jgi:hypothetical protein
MESENSNMKFSTNEYLESFNTFRYLPLQTMIIFNYYIIISKLLNAAKSITVFTQL